MKYISKDADDLKISYIGAKGETSAEIKAEILKALEYNLSKDMELGYTTIGPHRDDIKFELNGKDSKIFASQGQQRSIVLALKIAELEVFEKELGEKPVLVLDDVFSELDSTRQKSLYKKFSGVHVLIGVGLGPVDKSIASPVTGHFIANSRVVFLPLPVLSSASDSLLELGIG